MIDFTHATSHMHFSPQTLLVEFVSKIYCRKASIGSEATVELYEDDSAKLSKFFAEHWCAERGIPPRPMQVADFSESLLQAAMRHDMESRGNVPNTANKLRRHMLAVWEYAADLSAVEHARDPTIPRMQPAKRILCQQFPEPKIEPRCWSLDELGKIIDSSAAMRGKINKEVRASTFHLAHSWFVYNTGARIDAVMRTPLYKLDLDRGEVQLPAYAQKQNAEQTFDLLPETIEALKRLRLFDRYPPEATIFADWPYDPTPGSWQILTKRYKQILTGAGLTCGPKDLFHKLRRTFATFLAIDQGIVAAQQWLGHSSVTVTWKYIDMRYYQGPRLNGSLPSPRPLADQVQLRVFRGDEAAG